MSGEFWLRDESFDDDDDLDNPEYDIWICAKCNKDFIDPEDYPDAEPGEGEQIEPRLYWLSPTEPVCHSCATKSGLPPIDKE